MEFLLHHVPADQIKPYYCEAKNAHYTQLFQHFPFLSHFYTPFEKNFDASEYVDIAKATWPALPLFFIVAYILMITVGGRIMRNREKFDLKTPLAYWNLCLSLFSFCGMLRTVPHLLNNLTTMSFRDTVCTSAAEAYGNGASGLWVMLFIFSKVPELNDTTYITLRKSKLHFLHWYHHITVLLFCWHSYATESSTGLYFVAMNYSVHAIMYGYYYLMSIKAWPKWIPAQLITVAQISQMVVGTSICIASFIFKKDGQQCAVEWENVVAGALMYGSYLYLFSEFFVRRFILKSMKPKVKKLE